MAHDPLAPRRSLSLALRRMVPATLAIGLIGCGPGEPAAAPTGPRPSMVGRDWRLNTGPSGQRAAETKSVVITAQGPDAVRVRGMPEATWDGVYHQTSGNRWIQRRTGDDEAPGAPVTWKVQRQRPGPDGRPIALTLRGERTLPDPNGPGKTTNFRTLSRRPPEAP